MGLPQRLCHDAQNAGWPHISPMNRSLALLTAAALLSGCQTFAPSSPDGVAPVEDPAITEQPAQPQVYRAFSQETVLALLTAELAGQRNRFDIALDNYLQQANATQDAGVAERGFRIAEYLGAEQAALETSLLWAKTRSEERRVGKEC